MTGNIMGSGRLLVLKDLNVWYIKGKPVLERFSVELGNNEIVGLIGLNGAGKTNFIKTLSGLLDSFKLKPLCGRISRSCFVTGNLRKNGMLSLPKTAQFSFLRSASMLPMWRRLTAGSYLILMN